MNNKSKRILALTSAAAILATSMPITAFAEVDSNNGLEIGPEIGVHSNVRAISKVQPRTKYEWKKYNITKVSNTTYKDELVEEEIDLGSSFIIGAVAYLYENDGHNSMFDPELYQMLVDYGFKFEMDHADYNRFIADHIQIYTACMLRERYKDVDKNSIDLVVYERDATGTAMKHKLVYKIKKSVPTTIYTDTKGEYIKNITSTNIDDYPKDDKKNGYWYEYVGSETTHTWGKYEIDTVIKRVKNPQPVVDPNAPEELIGTLQGWHGDVGDIYTGGYVDMIITRVDSKEGGNYSDHVYWGKKVHYNYEEKEEKVKGKFISPETSTNRSEYPDNGIKGDYWYVYGEINSNEALEFKPKVTEKIVEWGKPIDNLKDNIVNLNPKATVSENKENINTKKSGKYYAKVDITFSDGSIKKDVQIPVTVKPSESENFNDRNKDDKTIHADPKEPITVVKGEQPDRTKIVKEIENKEKNPDVKNVTTPDADTSKTGKGTAKVVVEFNDGSTTEIDVPINVVDTDAAKFNEESGLTPIIVNKNDEMTKDTYKTAIKNNTENKITVDKIETNVDTATTGKKTAKVELKFADNSTKSVNIEVIVFDVEKEKIVDYGTTLQPEDFVKGTSKSDEITFVEVNTPNTKSEGTQNIKVKVKSSGTEKIFDVKLTVNPSKYKDFTITPIKEVVKWSGEINLKDNIKEKLPDGSDIKDITTTAIDTKKPGNYNGKIKITFPDGLEKEVDIPVEIKEKESKTFVPDIKDITVKRTRPADISEPFNNKPNGATITVKTPVDTKEVGKKTGVVTVIFSDTSTGDFDIPVTVTALESDTFKPTIEDEIVTWGTEYDLTDNIKKLPEGATVEDITPSKINTKQSGEHTGKVKITFKDGSTQEVEVPVTVNKSESENYSKEFNNATDVITERVIKGGTIDFTDNFKKPLPEGSTVQDITDPAIDTNKDRKYTGKAQVTFKDGSTMEVSIPVEIYISGSIIKPIPKVNNSDIEDEVVNWSGKIDLTNNIKNLPDTAKVKDITDPVIDTTKPGKYTGKVEITFPDGSKRVVEVPIEVKKAQSETFTPEINEEKLPYGKEVTPSDIIKNIPDDANAEFVGDNKIDPTKSGKQNATIKITFADGSTKEYPVEVEIDKSQAEKYKENPSIEPERISRNGKIDLTDNIKDLPDGSTVVDTTKDKIDTSKLGTSTGTVEVTFPDGTKAEFEVPVEVYKTEAEAFENPIITREVVKTGEEVDLTDNVVNLPEGAKVVDTTEPKINTTEPGEHTATAKIVFKDGSEKEIEVKVVVTDGKDTNSDNNYSGNVSGVIGNDTSRSFNRPTNFNVKSDGDIPEYKTKSDENNQESKHKALDSLLNGPSTLGRRDGIKSNENDSMATKYVFKIGEKSYKTIHGDNVTSHKMDVAPYIKNDRTMMPLRYVAEAIGADVQWDNSTRTAYFEKDGLVAKIQIDGNKIVMSNGKVYEMDAKPDNINDRILVSITNVSKVFNLTNGHTKDGINQNIEWNNDNKTVTIVK